MWKRVWKPARAVGRPCDLCPASSTLMSLEAEGDAVFGRRLTLRLKARRSAVGLQGRRSPAVSSRGARAHPTRHLQAPSPPARAGAGPQPSRGACTEGEAEGEAQAGPLPRRQHLLGPHSRAESGVWRLGPVRISGEFPPEQSRDSLERGAGPPGAASSPGVSASWPRAVTQGPPRADGCPAVAALASRLCKR